MGLLAPASALASPVPVEETLDPRWMPLQNTNFDMVVVSVTETYDEGATNGDPPKSEVRVEEVLRGQGQPETVTTVWQSAPEQGNTGGFRDGEYVEPEIREEWYSEPLEGPEAGRSSSPSMPTRRTAQA